MSDFNPYNHLGFLTNRVARLMGQLMAPCLQEKGLHFPTSCIGIMADLWAKDGVSQKELGMSLIKNKSSINKMLKSLEEHGMIGKREDTVDKRKKRIFLTQKGKAFQKDVEAMEKKVETQLLSRMSAAEITTTKFVLKELYHNLSEKITNRPAWQDL